MRLQSTERTAVDIEIWRFPFVGRRKWLAALLAVATAVCVLIAAIRRNALPEPPPLDGSTITVVPGVHLIGRLGPSAAYAIETPEGIVLVDSGLDGDAAILKEEMARLNLDWRKVRAILLTHVHGDHCGGAEHLRAATGATVYTGREEAPILRVGTPREAFFSTFKMPGYTPHPTSVDVELAGDERLEFGNVRFQALGAPGHTPGSICYLMDRDGLRVLFSGDVIQSLGERPLGTYSAYLAPRYRGDAETYRATLDKLRRLPVPDLLLPGHPRANRVPISPRLTTERWQEMLDQGIKEMQQLERRYAVDGANFLDGSPKRLLPDFYYLGDFEGSSIYGFFKDSNFFVVDAPGGIELPEFIKSSLRQLGLTPAEPTAVLLTACGEQETSGLKELVERSHAQVVARAEGIEHLKSLLPPDTAFCPTNDLPQREWFDVRPIPLAGRGLAPTAYAIRWAGKLVVISGRYLSPRDQDELARLEQQLAASRANLQYERSLRMLLDLRPDLWLPAVPVNGQNANVYGNSWRELLEANYRAIGGGIQGR